MNLNLPTQPPPRPPGFIPRPIEGTARAERNARKPAKVQTIETPRRKFTKHETRETYKKCDKRCVDCGKGVGDKHEDGAPVKLHIDHQKPLKAGGTYDLHNLVLRCDRHNLAKGAIRDFAAERRATPSIDVKKENEKMVSKLAELVGKPEGAKR